jgi:hypothetical protein
MARCLKEEIEATGEISIETTAIKKIVKPPMKDRIIADPTDAITSAAQEETGKKILKIWKTSKTMGTKARTVELMTSKRIR